MGTEIGSRTIIGQKVLLRAVFKTKIAERKKFCGDLNREDLKGDVLRLVKQLVWSERTFNHQNLIPTFPWKDNCLMVTKWDFLENGSVTMTKQEIPTWKCC